MIEKTITMGEWVDALESGEYKRAATRLRDPKTGRMCCLGVACEIAGVPRTDRDGYSYYLFEHPDEGVEAASGLWPDWMQDLNGIDQRKIYPKNDDMPILDLSYSGPLEYLKTLPRDQVITFPVPDQIPVDAEGTVR